uniref:Uncharacterized protein n=1 Tax=Arundo donax TaxID=35708 RepID=A0A0A9HS79_ARUDO
MKCYRIYNIFRRKHSLYFSPYGINGIGLHNWHQSKTLIAYSDNSHYFHHNPNITYISGRLFSTLYQQN